MDKKLKSQINSFLEKSNFLSTAQTNQDIRSRFRLSSSQRRVKQLPTGISISGFRSKSNNSSLNSSKESSPGNTIAMKHVRYSSDSKKRDGVREYRSNLRRFNYLDEISELQLFLNSLFLAKIKDINVESNQNTEKAFMIRMQLGLRAKKLNCAGLTVGQNSLLVIRKYLKVDGRVINLILDNNFLNDQCFTVVAKIIKQSTITRLSLVSTNMNSQSCKLILDSLLLNNHLSDLNLSSYQGLYRNKLGAQGLKPFKKLLKMVPNIHMINLNGSSISQEGFKSICEGLINNDSLFGLEVARNLISQKLFQQEAVKLSNCQIGMLDLTGNTLKDKGIILLGDILGTHYAYNTISVRLKHLNLSQNKITLHGLEQFSKRMVRNSTIQQLILDKNKLSKTGYTFQSFKTFISRNFSINLLSMKKISVQTSDLVLLFEGLEKNHSILHLDFSQNVLDEHAAKSLGLVFKKNSYLKSISLKQCSLMDKLIVHLINGLEYNSCIQKLHLDKNFLKDQSATLIQQLLIKRRNITLITVQKNLMSIKQSRQISQILSDNVFISSNQLSIDSFLKQKQNNKSHIQKLKMQVSHLNNKMKEKQIKNNQQYILDIMIEIDYVKENISREKIKIQQLQKIQSFITQKL